MTAETTIALVVLVVAVPLLWWLMWRGWRGRHERQADVPAPPAVPEGFSADLVAGAEGTYVTSTRAGEQLERVVPHGLGVPSAVVVRVGRAGVLLERRGAPDVWVPAADLLGARVQRGLIGKVVDAEGLLVLTWRLGDVTLDTGVRLRHEADRRPVLAAVTGLTGQDTP